MTVSIVVAFDDNKAIGNGGKIPWRLPEEMKHFRRVTMGHSVVMGRRTWDSLPPQKLPGRTCIVLSRDFVSVPTGFSTTTSTLCVTSNLSDALFLAKLHNGQKEVFIIGGRQIYEMALKEGVVDRILVSKINGTHEADTFFPELGPEWKETLVENRLDFDVVEFRK